MVLAPLRFEDYTTAEDESQVDGLARYLWNLRLCSDLYIPLHFLEVGLRNSIHNAIRDDTGAEYWFDNLALVKPEHRGPINEARKSIKKARKAATADRIVSNVSLGFWTLLLSKEYEQRIFNRYASQIFPGLPRREQERGRVCAMLEDCRRLRNRVFHHEPIWQFENLEDRYTNLLEAIKSVHGPCYGSTLVACSFPHSLQEGWLATRKELLKRVAIIESQLPEDAKRKIAEAEREAHEDSL